MDIYPKKWSFDLTWLTAGLIATLMVAATAIHKNIRPLSSVTPKIILSENTLSLAERTEYIARLFAIDKVVASPAIKAITPKRQIVSLAQVKISRRKIDFHAHETPIRPIVIPVHKAAYYYPQIEGNTVEINNKELIKLKGVNADGVTSNWSAYFKNFRTQEGKTIHEHLLVLAKKEEEAAQKPILNVIKDEVRTVAARSVEYVAPELMDILPGMAQQEISIEDKVSQRVLTSTSNKAVRDDFSNIVEESDQPPELIVNSEPGQVHEIMLSPEPEKIGEILTQEAEVNGPGTTQADTQVSSQADRRLTTEEVSSQVTEPIAQEMTTQVDTATVDVEEGTDSDDFVVYDYAKAPIEPNSTVIDQKVEVASGAPAGNASAETRSYSSKVSPTVAHAISREIQDSDKPRPAIVANSDVAKELGVDDVASLLNSMAKQTAPVVENDVTDLALSIQAVSAEFNTGKLEPIENFEVKPYYALDVILDDEGKGVFSLKEHLSQPFGVFAAAITKEGHFQTDVDLQFSSEIDEKIIPLIERETWATYAEANGIMNQGAMILVEKTDEIEKIEIDVPFEKLVYLDNVFKITEDADFADYVLFVGARPGNVLLTYTTVKKVQSSKIVFAQEDAVYFDWPVFDIRPQEILEVVEGYVLENGKAGLDIDAQRVFSFTNGIVASKKGQNRYEIINNVIPRASRMYLEMSHLDDTIFVGRWDAEILEVPSEEYILTMLSKHGLSGLGGRCMVQINIEKGVTEVKMEARAANGQGGPLRITYLDKDGRLYEDPAESVKKIFLIGEQQGVMDGKISYMDGTVDYLQTYCSPDTYLVEQF